MATGDYFGRPTECLLLGVERTLFHEALHVHSGSSAGPTMVRSHASHVDETSLEKATRHVMIGARILACQKRLIAELRADGHDTTSAEALLSTLIATQHIFEDHLRLSLKRMALESAKARR